jgi:DNA polymerase-3 subunit delta
MHLIFGKDNYQVRRALAAIRDALRAGDDMLESNTSVLDGRGLTPQELLAHATAMPFLASNRLVIVEGLLAAVGQAKGGRRKKKADPDDPLEAWRQAAAQLADKAAVPESTTVVFVEGELKKENAAFTIFAPLARTVEYAPLGGAELQKWITAQAKERKLKLSPGAAQTLAGLVGGDLWALANDLDKLAAHAGGEAVDELAVADLVSGGHNSKVWDLTDALVAGDERKALTVLQRLLVDGEPPPLLSSVVARQYRQLVMVKDMRERRAAPDEVARASGVPAFRVNAVGAIAARYSWPMLRAAYQRLLDADLSVKRGLQDDESALQLLVHDLCALAPKAGRPAYAR